jgi:TRAP-type C4-dicarboxylate transport system permease small subunit
MKIEQTGFWKFLLKIQKALLIVFGLVVVAILAIECLGRPVGINFKGYEEILVIVVFWLYMFGCAYGSGEESQISADIISVMMKRGTPKAILSLIKYILTLVLGAVMLWWAIHLVQWSASQQTMTTVYRLPTTLGHASMVVGLGITTFYNVCYFVREIKRFVAFFRNPAEDKEEVTA